jgi:DNA invertase Pin-like site-specific DNA recombinase
MASTRYISYVRVSTQRQQASGLGLEAQQETIRSYLAGSSGELLAEHVEVESGTRADRPEIAKALAACRLHHATLIIAKLDRLARQVSFIANLLESGVSFYACDVPAANNLTLHLYSSIAEHEAKMISERTRVALAAAKRRGVKLGGFRGRVASNADRERARTAKMALADSRSLDLAATIRTLQSEGCTSYRGIATRLNEMTIPTTGSHNQHGQPTGHAGAWHGAQVARIISRIKILENRD